MNDEEQKMTNYNDSKEYGVAIPGSRWLRAFCSRCGIALRVQPDEIQRRKKDRRHYCEVCEPPHHIGCTSPPSPIDHDAGGVSIQDDYGDIPGE